MRTPINDEEDLLRAVQAFVKAGLNARITAVNAEKGDWDIPQIDADDDHYVFSGELMDLPNHAFVSFAVDAPIVTQSNKNDISSTLTIVVEVVFDNEKKANTYFKSLRYLRALYETLLEFEPSTYEVDGFQINKITPIIVTAKTLGRSLVISGVTISMVIG